MKLVCDVLLPKYLKGGRGGNVGIAMIWTHDYKESGNSLTSLDASFGTMALRFRGVCTELEVLWF